MVLDARAVMDLGSRVVTDRGKSHLVWTVVKSDITTETHQVTFHLILKTGNQDKQQPAQERTAKGTPQNAAQAAEPRARPATPPASV